MATAPDPGGARLRRRHSPRSRPASPRAPQRLAAMLELVRHRLRQWKERTGGGDPGGGAAGGGRGGGAETGEAAPRPGKGEGGRQPRYSPGRRRGPLGRSRSGWGKGPPASSSSSEALRPLPPPGLPGRLPPRAAPPTPGATPGA